MTLSLQLGTEPPASLIAMTSSSNVASEVVEFPWADCPCEEMKVRQADPESELGEQESPCRIFTHWMMTRGLVFLMGETECQLRHEDVD